MVKVRSELLPGPTAFRLGRLTLAAIGLWCIVVLPAGIVAGGFVSGSRGAIATAVVLLSVVPFVLHGLRRSKEAKELDSGYTTLPGDHINLEQRHPRTGQVVRIAGDPLMSQDQWKSVIAGHSEGRAE